MKLFSQVINACVQNLEVGKMQKRISVGLRFGLSLMFLLSSALVPSTVQKAYGTPYVDIEVSTAYNMITNGSYPNLLILDVRTQSEYDDGHLEGAILIPVTELESRIAELATHRDEEIIVYCRTGARSALASSILDTNNFTKVFNMLGGISAWESASYSVIPEFPSFLILPLFFIATLLAAIIYKKRYVKPQV